jgi:nucleoside-diphosphate-sugar epimerase
MQATVLVTGNSGWAGAAVAERLARKHQVVGFDRKPSPNPHAGFEHVRVELRSDASVRAGLDELRRRHGERLASVVHLASYCDPSGDPSPRYDEVNVRGTERLLRGLKDFQVEQFVLASTLFVHRPCRPSQHITEDWPLDPRWAFPRSKLQAEAAVRALHGRTPYVLVRLAGAYDEMGHYPPLAEHVQRILECSVTSHIFPGNARSARPFVHRDDLVEAFERVVDRRAELPHELPLLIGEPVAMSYADLQATLGRLIHHEEWETHEISKGLARMGAWLQDHLPFVPKPPVKARMIDQADDNYAVDISRAYKLLGWEPHHALKATLPDLVAALQADPRAWYRANGLQAPPDLKGSPEPAAAALR